MDAAGNIDITDRIKDMFIVGGFNAYPAEIENMILEHPAIAQVAVVGVPDERLGEVGMAFVVPATGADATPTSSSRGAARTWPTTRFRATWSSSSAAPQRDEQGAEVRACGARETARTELILHARNERDCDQDDQVRCAHGSRGIHGEFV